MLDPTGPRQMERAQFKATTIEQQDAETRAYWLSKSPEERIEALERLRMIQYGYDPATDRLQRVFRVLAPGECY